MTPTAGPRPSSTASGPPPVRVRVLVAGGGVAALEALLAIRARTDGELRPTILAPDARFRYRPLAAYAGLVEDADDTVDLARVAGEQGGGLICDRLQSVDTARGEVLTGHGGRIAYDALIVATGSVAREGLPGAITLGARGDEAALARLVARVREGGVERLAVVVPAGVGWSLPAYELALLLRHVAPEDGTRIAVVTAEDAPMEAAGEGFSSAISELLERRNVELVPGTWPEALEDGRLWLPMRGGAPVDAVVALARPYGPAIPGLPCDAHGFLPVDARGRVLDESRVWAAGDAAAHPLKQGGLAVQQADAVADDVAVRLGLKQLPDGRDAFSVVLRAALLDGEGTLYLRAERGDDGEVRTETSREPLWWPPTKIAGGRLPHYLAGRAG